MPKSTQLVIDISPILKARLQTAAKQSRHSVGSLLRTLIESHLDGGTTLSTLTQQPPPLQQVVSVSHPPTERTLDTSDSQEDHPIAPADRGYRALFIRKHGRIPKSQEELDVFKSQRLTPTTQNNP